MSPRIELEPSVPDGDIRVRILGLILLLLGCGAAWGAEPSGVMILDFQSKGILDKAVLRQLWDRTYEIAVGIPGVDFVPAENARKRLFDQNILIAARCDEACYQRVAQKLGAKEMLVPSVEKSGNQLKISFVRMRGSNGQKLQDVSVWSDGRVGRALTSGLFSIFVDGSEKAETVIPPAAWRSAGILVAGVGLTWWLGATQAHEADHEIPAF